MLHSTARLREWLPLPLPKRWLMIDMSGWLSPTLSKTHTHNDRDDNTTGHPHEPRGPCRRPRPRGAPARDHRHNHSATTRPGPATPYDTKEPPAKAPRPPPVTTRPQAARSRPAHRAPSPPATVEAATGSRGAASESTRRRQPAGATPRHPDPTDESPQKHTKTQKTRFNTGTPRDFGRQWATVRQTPRQ